MTSLFSCFSSLFEICCSSVKPTSPQTQNQQQYHPQTQQYQYSQNVPYPQGPQYPPNQPHVQSSYQGYPVQPQIPGQSQGYQSQGSYQSYQPQINPYQSQQQAYPPQQPIWNSSQSTGGQHTSTTFAEAAGGSIHGGKHEGKQGGKKKKKEKKQKLDGTGKPSGHVGGYGATGSAGYDGLPVGGVVGPHHPAFHNSDQVNATNSRYLSLREQARKEGDEAHRCFSESKSAYQIGNGAKAKELSMEAKQHQKRQKELDEEASNWIFHENNQSSPPNTIDLHGLYVKEALERVETAISRGQKMKQKELKVIVGKGIHSQGHVAKVKPAVEGLMMKYNLSAHLDPDNPGVLIVHLTGSDGMNPNGNSREIGSFVDNLGEKGNDGCLIM